MKKLKITILVILCMLSSIGVNAQTKRYVTRRIYNKIKATLVAPNGKGCFFTNTEYYRQNLRTDKLEKSAIISGNFKGLVTDFDAALTHTNGKGYFFKDNKYYRYNFYTQKVDKTGTIGKDGWRGVPSNIDAAVVHSNGKAYFFKGSKYYRYNSAIHKVDKIAEISKNWKGVPDNVEAALLHTNGKVYFFKNNKYYRYSTSSRKVDKIGTIGVDGWKGLSFFRRVRVLVRTNSTTSSKSNIRLKVTLTRIKSIQARDSDDIADFEIWQWIHYSVLGNKKETVNRNIKALSRELVRTNYNGDKQDEKNTIISSSYKNQIHVREGDEKHYINNSLTFEILPKEINNQRVDFKINTSLFENSGVQNTKHISKNNPSINVNIYEVLDYLQNPNKSKYGRSYFSGGRAGNMHEYGAYGDVMWFKKGSNNSLIGHLEFGDNSKETYVRLYYRFELIP